MLLPKKYVRDRSVLALLTVCGSVFILTVLDTVLRVSQATGSYIVACRNCQQAIPDFSKGTVLDILDFLIFGVLILAITMVMSARTYRIHRQLSLIVLLLGLVLLVFNLRVVDALLSQR